MCLISELTQKIFTSSHSTHSQSNVKALLFYSQKWNITEQRRKKLSWLHLKMQAVNFWNLNSLPKYVIKTFHKILQWEEEKKIKREKENLFEQSKT